MTENDPRPCAVMAIYNDRETLRDDIAAVMEASAEDVTLIVVDDGSTDGTTAADASAAVIFLRLPRNVGRTSALRAGIRQAGDHAVVILDPANAGTAWELERRRRRAGADVAVAQTSRSEGPRAHPRPPVLAGRPAIVDRLLACGPGADIEAEAERLGASLLWMQ